jgi:transcriptional regulator with XRE-family HTH domain
MGLKVTTIDKWEEDLAEPRANRLQMMSGLLGVSLTWLLTAKGEGPDGPDGGAPVTADLRDILNELRQVRSDLVRETDRIGVLEKRLRQVLKETGE